jgi:hypothetical protein
MALMCSPDIKVIDIIQKIVLTKFHEDLVENIDTIVLTRFFVLYVLYDLVTCVFTQAQPNSISITTSSRQSFRPSFMKIWFKI